MGHRRPSESRSIPGSATPGVRARGPEAVRAGAAEPPFALRFRKWDGSPGRQIPLRPERVDGFGRWYRWPAGEPMTRRSGPPVRHGSDFVVLVPDDERWIARWGLDGDLDLYCDVTTGTDCTEAGISAVDLDLDVVRYRSGRVAVVDQEQFDRRRIAMGYPTTVAARALQTARWLYRAITAGVEPFGTVGADYLATVRSGQ